MKIITIVGPTAAGKTAIAMKVAEKIPAAIISADSRQVYKYLDIGTAKPSPDDRKKVPFHLIDFVDPRDTYSSGQFARDAETKISEVLTKNKIPIVCGGTGLYIRALFNPFHNLPPSDKQIRNHLLKLVEKKGLEYLYQKLQKLDPDWAIRVNPKDRQRILRGLEVYEMTGQPLTEFLKSTPQKAKFLPYYIGINLPRPLLYHRINQRFKKMIEDGLIEETESLLKKGFSPQLSALRTIGYKEIIQYLQGECSLQEAVARAQQRTRNFARRQITWFKAVPGLEWYDPGDENIVKVIIEKLKSF